MQRSAINPSTQASRLGHQPLVLSAVGFDEFGPTLLRNAKNFRIRPPMNSGGALFLRNHSFLI